ncbi:MAG: hypothetical protein HY270_21480 [Deltaproteobacteria bacterium]|nr:hypothetical protein [Deltaproteobacteria bacterium]
MNWNQIGSQWKEVLAAFAVFTVSAAVTPAFAMKSDLGPTAEQPALNRATGGSCVPLAAKDVLQSYELSILNAPTVEEARQLILSQTGRARTVLSTASWLLPFSSSVREARDKIAELEQRVYAANTQTEVANDFSDFLAVPSDAERSNIVDHNATDSSLMVLAENNLDHPAVHVDTGGGHGCNYTNGEVIIIVIGFVLGIIPGIIFLFIFC